MPFKSFTAVVILTAALGAIAGAAVAMFAFQNLSLGVWPSYGLALAAALTVSLVFGRFLLRPVHARLRALATAVSGLGEGDFSVGVAASGFPELDALLDQFNLAGTVLRDQRLDLHHRELLLDTVIQTSPLAMVLLDQKERVSYSNEAARKLLFQGRKLEGLRWDEVVRKQNGNAQAALAALRSGLFNVEDESGDQQVFLLNHKHFRLNGRDHRLLLLQQLTRELNRREVATWKKVIRVISHELNNSIAPISSMLHSSQVLVERGDTERLLHALDSLSGRVKHLAGFIERYAEFARLPTPRLEPVVWSELVQDIEDLIQFSVVGTLPTRTAKIDRAQFEQALINLLKNANEAQTETSEESPELSVHDTGEAFVIDVRDRGTGMSPETLAHALVPFYSTKRSGSGIGLSLVREIVEAHDGRISLRNRTNGGLVVRIFLPG